MRCVFLYKCFAVCCLSVSSCWCLNRSGNESKLLRCQSLRTKTEHCCQTITWVKMWLLAVSWISSAQRRPKWWRAERERAKSWWWEQHVLLAHLVLLPLNPSQMFHTTLLSPLLACFLFIQPPKIPLFSSLLHPFLFPCPSPPFILPPLPSLPSPSHVCMQWRGPIVCSRNSCFL